MFTRHITASIALLIAGAAMLVAQTGGAVKVTAARANVRSDANDKAPVVTQVVAGTMLALRGEEGDWYRVELPPDPRAPGIRLQAFISKKVVAIVAAPAAPPTAAAAAPPVVLSGGLSVAVQIAGATQGMAPEMAAVRRIDGRIDPARVLSGVLPLEDVVPADAAAPGTFAWALAGASSARVTADVHPTFVATLKDVPAFSVETLMPVLLRLTPTLSGARVVSAVRARADQPSRDDVDWDVMKDLKQNVVRTTGEEIERGLVRVVPAANLDPGEYAVVFRPRARTLVSGASALSPAGAGAVLGAAWSISIRPSR